MSGSAQRLSIVVPAFNEAGRIEPTLREMLDALTRAERWGEVIVVDDGSTDATTAVALRLAEHDPRLRVIRLPDNHGKGYAVRTGVANALGERVLFADADGSTPIAEIARLEAALDAGADVAIGSRAVASAQVRVEANPLRRVVGRIFHRLVQSAGVRGIADTQCGFKLFTARAAADLFPRLRLTGYAFDVELLLAAQRRGMRVAEVPVNWTHQPGSKVSVVRDGLRMARDVIRIRSYALRGSYSTPRSAGAPVAVTTT
jgi:dolichyl-phosphate beta-glucosyltransferase